MPGSGVVLVGHSWVFARAKHGRATQGNSTQQKLHLHLTLVPHGHNKFLLLNLLSLTVSGAKVRIMKMWFLVVSLFARERSESQSHNRLGLHLSLLSSHFLFSFPRKW